MPRIASSEQTRRPRFPEFSMAERGSGASHVRGWRGRACQWGQPRPQLLTLAIAQL
jgi:hypothetical protein